jgi:hypothetical protein
MSSTRYQHTATLLGNGKVLIAGGYRLEGAFTVPTDTAEIFDPTIGKFTLLSSRMTSKRQLHSATLLPNGKVLIAGGAVDFSGTTNTAELFDPATESFTALPAMNSPRDSHTATLLPSGKVLLAGGFNGTTATFTAEIFDPATGTFTSLAPNAMSSPRNNHTATLLSNGKVLIAGGFNGGGATNSAELFDPATETFTALSSTLSAARNVHTATVLPGGKVLIAGGQNGTTASDTADLFDPISNTFTAISSTMSSPRYFHSATLLPDGNVLIAGGTPGGVISNTADLFDPTSARFTPVTAVMTSARYLHSATLLPSGEVVLVGGHTGSVGGPTASAEVFTYASGSFAAASSLNVARFFPTATLLPNGKVLIAGGQPGTGPTTTAELFDPIAGTFSLLPNQMNIGRYRHTATLLPNGKVLIAGGDTSSVGTGVTNTAELFDPVSETFTLLPSMASPRWSHTATLLPDGKVLIVGGLSSSDFMVTNTAELFDPLTNSFTTTGSMSVPRYFHTATLLTNGKVLVAGGFHPALGGLNTAEVFDEATGTFTLLPNLMATKRYYHSSTLLPNGRVFIAGGGGSPPPTSPLITGSVITNTAELFDPATETFTLVPNTMNSYRYWQTATLLPSGKVLLADGSTIDYAGAEYTMTAELFDPSNQTFTLLPLMNSVRFGHTATVLPDGRVLIAAGTTGSTATATAEIFDEGLGFSDGRRPAVSTAMLSSGAVTVTGIGFRGDSEGSGGSFSSSATNYPLLQLTRIDNEQTFFALSDPATNWSDTSFNSVTLGSNLLNGAYRVTIFTNAIPSLQKLITIGPPLQLVSAVSRKTHGSVGDFDIDLPLTGNPGIECRSGPVSGAHRVVVTFANAVTVTNATVTPGQGGTASLQLVPGPNHAEVLIDLSNVSNAQTLTINLLGVSNGTNTSDVHIPMGILLGDVDASRRTDAGDVTQVRNRTVSIPDQQTFRFDVNTSGRIDSGDVTVTRNGSITVLP